MYTNPDLEVGEDGRIRLKKKPAAPGEAPLPETEDFAGPSQEDLDAALEPVVPPQEDLSRLREQASEASTQTEQARTAPKPFVTPAPAPTPAPATTSASVSATSADQQAANFSAEMKGAMERDARARDMNAATNLLHTASSNFIQSRRPTYQAPLPAMEADKLVAQENAKATLYNALKAKAGLKAEAQNVAEKGALLKEQARQRQLAADVEARLQDPNSEESKMWRQYAREQLGMKNVPDTLAGRPLRDLAEKAGVNVYKADQAAAAAAAALKQRKDAADARAEAASKRIEAKQAELDRARTDKQYMGEDFEVKPGLRDRFNVPEQTRASFIAAAGAVKTVRDGISQAKALLGNDPKAALKDPQKAGEFQSLLTNLQMQLKDYFGLGVIAGPDMQILSGTLPQVNSWVARANAFLQTGNWPDMERDIAALYSTSDIVGRGIRVRGNALGLQPVGAVPAEAPQPPSTTYVPPPQPPVPMAPTPNPTTKPTKKPW